MSIFTVVDYLLTQIFESNNNRLRTKEWSVSYNNIAPREFQIFTLKLFWLNEFSHCNYKFEQAISLIKDLTRENKIKIQISMDWIHTELYVCYNMLNYNLLSILCININIYIIFRKIMLVTILGWIVIKAKTLLYHIYIICIVLYTIQFTNASLIWI